MTYSKQVLDFARAEIDAYQQGLVKASRRTLYDRDIKWPWGKYKDVPLSCVPLEYFAWFVQQSTDKLWLGRIEKEMLCRQNGDKVMSSKTKFGTCEKVQAELAVHEHKQQELAEWRKDPRVKDWLRKPVVDTWYKKHGPGNGKLKAQRQQDQKQQNKAKAQATKGPWQLKQEAKKKNKQQQNKTITNNTKITTTTGSYTIPTHNFDGSPVDFSTAPF